MSVAAVAIGAQAAGGALSIIGTLQQGQAQAAAAKFNAQLRERDAQLSLDKASADAEALSRKSRKVIGGIESGFGASGVTAGGSVIDVIESSAAIAELDRQNILNSGRLKAMGFLEEAALEKARGRRAITGSRFQAASAFLTSASSAFAPSGTAAPSGVGGGVGGA